MSLICIVSQPYEKRYLRDASPLAEWFLVRLYAEVG